MNIIINKGDRVHSFEFSNNSLIINYNDNGHINAAFQGYLVQDAKNEAITLLFGDLMVQIALEAMRDLFGNMDELRNYLDKNSQFGNRIAATAAAPEVNSEGENMGDLFAALQQSSDIKLEF